MSTKQLELASIRSRGSGFTLVELLVSLAIMAVLATVVWPLAELAHRQQKEEELRHALRTIRDALDAHKDAVDEGRIRLPADASGFPSSLTDLTQGVPDAKSPRSEKIYFLRALPRDPFAAQDLPAEATWALRSYESPPEAPAPGKDVFDVKSKSAEVGTNGVPYSKW